MKILYEDNHIIVAYKPKGVLSQGDGSDKPDMLEMLKAYIKEKYNKPGNVYLGLVHRLDINTDGIMVFAKTSKAAARLSDSIKRHELEKRYLATVEGRLTNTDFVELKSYIKKDEAKRKSFIDKNGQEAILLYRAIKSYKVNNMELTDIEVILKTGRFHQIRCQMASIGHPLYKDSKYGSKIENKDNFIPLTAYMLAFNHPTTKERMTFTLK